ncbi:hypothetical protein BHU72_06955 [Desulfuribacillus stibiiarsenatis]|uniref:NADH:ubiquinone oxidoreductase-like 20kDa subunit domain-containing protein n=1 Tax=Desulfuribacillus stibiiarsenatis TaxID=1390249 RepID=A0A1E5L4B1_9FIRM|nr:hypothetical protein [Desulfuribacillus stibiiarsenatis]OEH84924.1 hypothetical protein BHU72_06955 [Desulfuribacillus stibiiarsenatis]
MNMKRRDFIKWVTASAAVLGIGSWELARIKEVLASMNTTPIVWLQAAGCSGCTISFLNMVDDTINQSANGVSKVDQILINQIELDYHQDLMVASGNEAIQRLLDKTTGDGNFILIVEGAIPTAANGMYCVIGERNGQPWTAQQAVIDLGTKAKHIIAVGTCASSRGVSGAGTNMTQARSVEEVLGSSHVNKIYNLPGCPVHPYIIGETIVKLLAGDAITRDTKRRPLGSYNAKKHHDDSNCPLKGRSKTKKLGVCGNCFDEMGCKGKHDETKMSCYTRRWGTNWSNKRGCFGTGNMCIGCSSTAFPFAQIYQTKVDD